MTTARREAPMGTETFEVWVQRLLVALSVILALAAWSHVAIF